MASRTRGSRGVVADMSRYAARPVRNLSRMLKFVFVSDDDDDDDGDDMVVESVRVMARLCVVSC